MEGSISVRGSRSARPAWYREVAAGVALAAFVSVVAVLLAPHMPKALPLPAMVLALILAISLHSVARNRVFKPGLDLCAKPLLRCAVALLGMRVAVGDIVDLGGPVAIVIVLSMAATIVAGVLVAKALKQNVFFGLLVGSATGVCGASAALATSMVLPEYKGRDTDLAFVIVGVNLLATLAMLIYPPLCLYLGFDDKMTGVMLGGTIHDVAQVVGAGYGISDTAGNAAAIVKLFRVFLLLPVVLVLGFYVSQKVGEHKEARVALPTFAIVFLVLCIVNSICSSVPALKDSYHAVKSVAVELSTWGLLLAISAIGLNTSIKAMSALGWRHVANLLATTIMILILVTTSLLYLQ